MSTERLTSLCLIVPFEKDLVRTINQERIHFKNYCSGMLDDTCWMTHRYMTCVNYSEDRML